MEINKEGLDCELFEDFAKTSKKIFLYMENLNTNVTRISKTFADYFGLEEEYYTDFENIWIEKIYPDDREKFLKGILLIKSYQKKRHELTYRVLNKNNQYVSITCSGIVTKTNCIDFFIGTVENNSLLQSIDSITGLYNSYALEQYIKDVLLTNEKLSVLEFTIPNLKEIYELYGSTFVEIILSKISNYFLDNLPVCCKAFKGGESSFYITFLNQTKDFMNNIFNEFCVKLNEGIDVGDIKLTLQIVGGAIEDCTKYNESAIICGLRSALNSSLYLRTNELAFFNDVVSQNHINNLTLLQKLRKSIAKNCENFYMVYQPIVDAENEILKGCEALVRFDSPTTGFLSPQIFIPWLEMDPSFYDLGKWIIHNSLLNTKSLLKQIPDFYVSINITYTQLSHPDFIKDLKNSIEEIDYPTKNICLELTERCRQLETSFLKKKIQEIQALGIKVAIDDFGTGTATLSLLKELPVQWIKIDYSFIKDIINDPVDCTIVRSMCNCARELNINVCAEGLESRDLIDFAKQIPFTSYQGFYFSKPIKIDEFVAKYNCCA